VDITSSITWPWPRVSSARTSIDLIGVPEVKGEGEAKFVLSRQSLLERTWDRGRP